MPDYIFLLESRLSAEQRSALARVQEIAQAQQANLYLTGGAVRDLITGMVIRDLDFTVEANPGRMARELEKSGARVAGEDDRLRHIELVWPGEVDLSVAAARDEVYARPGAKPETRWATVIEDLRRRDFSVNAIGISLNPASRGLLLDPTNGLADIEKREVRVLTMHSFTNQPIRLLRILRFCARLGFKMEPRTAEWFALALERRLHESLDPEEVGMELRQLAREEKCAAVLKLWEARGLLGVVHARFPKRRPDYEGLAKLANVREAMLSARVQPRLFAPVTHYLFARLSPRERASALYRMRIPSREVEAVHELEAEAAKAAKMLKSRKAATPREAYYFVEKVPPYLLAFILAEGAWPRAAGKIRMFLKKWRPMRLAVPEADLEAMGVPRGPKFDKILEDFFHLQLAGKARNPQDRIRFLRQLAGLKPEVKKKVPKKKAKEAARAEVPPAGAPKGKPKPGVGAPAAAAPPAPPARLPAGKAVGLGVKGKRPKEAAAAAEAEKPRPVAAKPARPAGAPARAKAARERRPRVKPPARRKRPRR